MQQYEQEAAWEVARWERNYASLSARHKYVLISTDKFVSVSAKQSAAYAFAFAC